MPTVAQLEKQKKDAREFIEHRELAARLMRNRDFQKLISDEWMVKEAARLVALSADPILDDKHRADALAMAQAPGHLKRWLNVIEQMGNSAENDLEELDSQIEEARLEEEQEQAERDAEVGVKTSDERGNLQ